jgi:hypothetical protein
MHLDLEAALHLPLLHGIEALHLQGCQVDKRSLAVLGNCKHLKQLSLANTQLAAGAAEPLHVLAAEGSPGLQLTLDHVQGNQASSILAALAPTVTHVTVKTTTTQELRAVLIMAVQKQCPRLQHIHLSASESKTFTLPLMGIRQLASACPQLQSLTCRRIMLPSMQCLRALLEMQQLHKLAIFRVRDGGQPGASIRWPGSKQPMSLSLGGVTLSEMSALPLQHCSDMLAIDCLSIPPGQTREQLADAMRAALRNAAKCPQVEVISIAGGDDKTPVPGAGLSALTADSPLQLKDGGFAEIGNAALEPEDIQGVAAAWGTSLEYLALDNCTLSASAWAALASAHLPALATLSLRGIAAAHVQPLGAHLLAFLLAWPATRKLTVRVQQNVGSQWLSTWSDILRAHQRHNTQLVVT